MVLPILLLLSAGAAFAELKPHTLAAFDKHIAARERQMREQRIEGPQFLWSDANPERRRRVRAGEAVIEPATGKNLIEVDDGLIHDWAGAVFIPGVTLQQVVSFVQDYDNHQRVYQPEVIGSKLVGHKGNDFKIRLRLLKKKVITVVLNTEHEVKYFPVDATRQHSRSYSTRIAEVDNAGEPDERERPPGEDHGFLWRLNSYWRFQERDGGVWVECEAISLTRSVPIMLGWMITPIVKELPRESLENTLRRTRDGLAK